ncbi:F0F1 ATP synthase subunit epsilon [bacterium]|nr:F0F1 ATP synthase subunit epsilon [bacterium]
MSDFALEIYTQDRLVWKGRVESMVVPGGDGYLGVLAHHAPLVTTLGKGTLTVMGEEGELRIPLEGGFLEVAHNRATLLADRILAAEARIEDK